VTSQAEAPQQILDDQRELAARIGEATIAATKVETVAAGTFDRLLNGLVGFAGAACLIAITLLVFANATLRYTANESFIWADELVLGLVPWLAMCGVFLSVRHREIITVTFFTDLMPPALRRLSKALADLIAAVSFAYLAYVSIDYLGLFGRDRSVYLGIPTGWFTSAILVGSALVAGAFLIDAAMPWLRPILPRRRQG
jgi:TRAP-type C4-dicarboxylate transport system permease small subunit